MPVTRDVYHVDDCVRSVDTGRTYHVVQKFWDTSGQRIYRCSDGSYEHDFTAEQLEYTGAQVMRPISVQALRRAVIDTPGLRTPDMADRLGTSITIARWAVLECGFLEFYDGNRIRFREEVVTHA